MTCIKMAWVKRRFKTLCLCFLLSASASAPALASDTDTELAKKSQNPIENMVTVPLNSNFNYGYGSGNNTQYILDIKPVIPVPLTSSWNLITRTIIPVYHQPGLGGGYINGIGDINPTFFFTPSSLNTVLWGAGPVFMLPTATNNQLGQGKYSIGPSLAMLVMPGNWVTGFIVNNLWSVAGESSRPSVNQMSFQYFINYNFSRGWFITTSPTITADWMQDNSNRWTVPFGLGLGRVFHIGSQSLSASVQAYDNVVTPRQGGPSWQLELNISLLFPEIQ